MGGKKKYINIFGSFTEPFNFKSIYLLLEFVSTMTMSFFSFTCIRLDCCEVLLSAAADGDADD